jgi:hypothetical protein
LVITAGDLTEGIENLHPVECPPPPSRADERQLRAATAPDPLMNRRTFLRLTGAATAGLATTGTVTGDAPDNVYRPGGRRRGSPQAVNIDAYLSNEELAARLQQIDRQSDRTRLRAIAESAGLGVPVWEMQVGEGDTNVHIITQIHGDEPTGTEVAVKLLRQLALGNGRQVDEILDEITLTVVPRVNPGGAVYPYDYDDDGREEVIGRRTNTQPWSPSDSAYEPYYHYTSPAGTEPGYDMNRDFNIVPDFDASEDGEEEEWTGEQYFDMQYEDYTLYSSGLRLTPEVRGVTQSYIDADPDYAITHHHRGGNLVPDSGGKGPQKQSLLAIMAAYGPAYVDRSPFFPDDYDGPIQEAVNPFLDEATSTRSLQLNALVGNALAERGNSVFDSTTRYGYFPLWGSYLDAMTPQTDAAGMLYETSFQTDDLGHKAIGRYVQASVVGFDVTLQAIADGSIADVDAGDYFDYPLMGESISAGRDGGRYRP